MWTQGVQSSYRGAYWRFLWRIVRNYATNPVKLWMGIMTLLAGHHFLIYAHEVADELARAVPPEETPSPALPTYAAASSAM